MNQILDERFFAHRRRSTSVAGMITAAAAICLFAWRYYMNHVLNWDLFAIGATFVVVKLALMLWYRFTD